MMKRYKFQLITYLKIIFLSLKKKVRLIENRK